MTGPVNYKKRGGVYSYYCTFGGRRYRASLGVRDPKQAARLSNRIGYALADGPNSAEWVALKNDLPKATFSILTADRNVQVSPELSEFHRKFEERLERRVKLGEIASRTRDLYLRPATIFFDRMAELGVHYPDKISSEIVEDYIVWRKDSILKKGGSGRSLTTEYTTLSTIFNFGIEEGVFKTSPLKGKYKPDSDPPPAKPFTSEEIDRLEREADGVLGLVFLIFRWTGLRGSDAAALTWGAIDFDAMTLTWKTKKRGRWVAVPLSEDLYLRLLLEKSLVNPQPEDKIIPGATRAKLYRWIKQLGEAAGVEDCFPHRFRSYLVCDLLARGASLFDVSQLIGDSHAVVEKYYAAGTQQQQDRVRNILESSGQKLSGVVS